MNTRGVRVGFASSHPQGVVPPRALDGPHCRDNLWRSENRGKKKLGPGIVEDCQHARRDRLFEILVEAVSVAPIPHHLTLYFWNDHGDEAVPRSKPFQKPDLI